jgi:signal transduction histidine kinase
MQDTLSQSSRLEEVGSAAAGIAHDINNQLFLIVNHLAAPDLEAARAAASRCSALTASLLAYCKGEAPEIGPLDLSSFLRDFLTVLSLPSGVKLIANVPESLPLISADPLALARAMTNLISNACAAMQDQGTLCVTASPYAVEVADSGPGIPPENQKRIFEAFFSTKGANGTGLGLSIVREIMRRHGGSVTVFSAPGSGARFTLCFRKASRPPARPRPNCS